MITLIKRNPTTGKQKLVRKKPTKHAINALMEFEAAAVDLAFIGTMHEDDHDGINERYAAARKRIYKHLAK